MVKSNVSVFLVLQVDHVRTVEIIRQHPHVCSGCAHLIKKQHLKMYIHF